MKKGYSKFITPLHLFNIITQGFFTLVSPPLAFCFIAYLIDKNLDVGGWIYVVLILLGVFMGLYSMIVFIIRASAALEVIEEENKKRSEAITKK